MNPYEPPQDDDFGSDDRKGINSDTEWKFVFLIMLFMLVFYTFLGLSSILF